MPFPHSECSYLIFDGSGRKIKEDRLRDTEGVIRLPPIPSGIYYLSIYKAQWIATLPFQVIAR